MYHYDELDHEPPFPHLSSLLISRVLKETAAPFFIVSQPVISVTNHDAVRWTIRSSCEGMEWPFPAGGERWDAEREE
jgi:hypothetical protein